ncbi:MAG: RNA-binding protein [Caldisericia bacterium]|nr:RNA-binding protein [Caldisericia bacterium]
MNIFVSNLSFTTTEDELRTEFASFGELTSVNIIKDRMTNKSRGFGFVEMVSKEEAEKAIASLDGKSVNGRNITVAEAKPRERKPGGSFGGGGGGGGNRNRSW